MQMMGLQMKQVESICMMNTKNVQYIWIQLAGYNFFNICLQLVMVSEGMFLPILMYKMQDLQHLRQICSAATRKELNVVAHNKNGE
jgi:hypothetical protein